LITIVFGRAAQFILALLMMRVGTTLLTPQEMGRVSLLMTTVACFSLFLINPVSMFIIRRLHSWQANGVAKYYLILFTPYLILVALFSAILLPIIYRFGIVNFGLSLPWLIFLVSTSLIFNTLNQTAIPILNFLGYSGRFVVLSTTTLLVSFLCAIVLVKSGEPSAKNWLLGILLGQCFVGMLGIKILFSRLKNISTKSKPLNIDKKQFVALFNFAWPISMSAGLAWVQGQGYRYLLSGNMGLDTLGLFVAGYAISSGIISGFESVLTTYFQPRLYREVSINANNEQQILAWQHYASAVIPSLLLTAFFIITLTPELTKLFLGQKFQSASNIVVWGVCAETARVLMGVYSTIAHIRMRTHWLILPNIIGAIFSIVGCALLIPFFGAMGAGIGLATSGLVVVGTMHLLFSRHIGGGISIKPVASATICALALWGATSILRHLIPTSGWERIIVILFITGMAELSLQYLFLRQHLIERAPV
jgi:O-antigen/teichoic acid export membrane protein